MQWMVLIAIVALGLGLYWVYYSRTTRIHIYVVPHKKIFILSKGNNKILFDSLMLFIPPKDFADRDINAIGISKFGGGADASVPYVVLDRHKESVATVPYREINSVILHKPGNSKPVTMSLSEFEKNQHNILTQKEKR